MSTGQKVQTQGERVGDRVEECLGGQFHLQRHFAFQKGEVVGCAR